MSFLDKQVGWYQTCIQNPVKYLKAVDYFKKRSILDVRQSCGYCSLFKTKKFIVLNSIFKTKKRTILETNKRHSAELATWEATFSKLATWEATFSKFVTVRSSCQWDNFYRIGYKNHCFNTVWLCFEKVYRTSVSIIIKTRLFQGCFLGNVSKIFQQFSE